jgi:hypothetical protein
MLQSCLFLHIYILLYGKIHRFLQKIKFFFFRIFVKVILVHIILVFIQFIISKISDFRLYMQFIQLKQILYLNIHLLHLFVVDFGLLFYFNFFIIDFYIQVIMYVLIRRKIFLPSYIFEHYHE